MCERMPLGIRNTKLSAVREAQWLVVTAKADWLAEHAVAVVMVTAPLQACGSAHLHGLQASACLEVACCCDHCAI